MERVTTDWHDNEERTVVGRGAGRDEIFDFTKRPNLDLVPEEKYYQADDVGNIGWLHRRCKSIRLGYTGCMRVQHRGLSHEHARDEPEAASPHHAHANAHAERS